MCASSAQNLQGHLYLGSVSSYNCLFAKVRNSLKLLYRNKNLSQPNKHLNSKLRKITRQSSKQIITHSPSTNCLKKILGKPTFHCRQVTPATPGHTPTCDVASVSAVPWSRRHQRAPAAAVAPGGKKRSKPWILALGKHVHWYCWWK